MTDARRLRRNELARIRFARFRAENPNTGGSAQLNRKAKKYGLPGRVTKAQLEEAWSRHQGKCFLQGPDCAGDACEWDHGIPVTRHGSSGDILNLFPACRRCNGQKNALTLTEWRREMRWRLGGTSAGWISTLALIGEPPEHREHMFKAGIYPDIHETAIVDAFCTVDAGVFRATTIGAQSWLQKRVHLGHDVVVGKNCEICVGVVVCGEVTIGDGVKIGGNSWLKPLITVGEGAIIGGGSVVTKDVPAHEVWCGNPATFLKNAWTHPAVRGLESRLKVKDHYAMTEEEWGDARAAAERRFPETEEVWELLQPWHHRAGLA